MTCRYRFVFPGDRIECGEKISDPTLLEQAARRASALGVTIMVMT